MSNSRNYVCKICDSGFTFVRSFEKHKCSGAATNRTAEPSTNRELESPKKISKLAPKPILPRESTSSKVAAVIQKPTTSVKPATVSKDIVGQKTGDVQKVATSKEAIGQLAPTPPKVVIKQKATTAQSVAVPKKTVAQLPTRKMEGVVRLPNTGTGSNIIAAIAQSEFVDAIEPETVSESVGSEVQIISETKVSTESTFGLVSPERRQSAPNPGQRGNAGSPGKMQVQVYPSKKMQKCRYCDRSSQQIEVHCVLHHFKDEILGFSRNKRSCNICNEHFADENELALHIGFFHFVLQEIQARVEGSRTKPIQQKTSTTKQDKGNIDPTWTPAEESTPKNPQRSRSLENKPQDGTKETRFQREKSLIRTGEGKSEQTDSAGRVQGRIGKLVKKEAWKTSETKAGKPTPNKPTSENPTSNNPTSEKITPIKPTETIKPRVTERVTRTSERPVESAKKGAESVKREAESAKKVAESTKKEVTRPTRKPAEITTDGRSGKAGADPARADRLRIACGTCVKCTLKNCGNCVVCQDRPEFGGQGKLGNKVCVKKVCRNKN